MSQVSNLVRHASGPRSTQHACVGMLTRTFSTKRPDDDVQEGAPKYKNTSVIYHEFAKDQSEYYLNNYTTSAHRDAITVKSFIGTDMLDVTDPVLREEIRAREAEAVNDEVSRQKKFREVIGSDKQSPQEKIRELIKSGATSEVVLNAMYHLMPRTAATKDHGHTIERLDWKGQAREHMIDEVDLSGYDVEDSSDPDTLPRQRPFTVDEMNRLLQDVEESQYIESDMEEHLFTPSDIMTSMSSMKNSVELRENFSKFVSDAPAETEYDNMTFADYMNWKPEKVKAKKSFESNDVIDVIRSRDGDFPRNKLEDMILEDSAVWKARRFDEFGEPHTIGLHSGQRSFEDIVQYSFHTNPGVGLIPANADFTSFPFAKRAQPQSFDIIHDPYSDRYYPFTLRIDEVIARYLDSKQFKVASEKMMSDGETISTADVVSESDSVPVADDTETAAAKALAADVNEEEVEYVEEEEVEVNDPDGMSADTKLLYSPIRIYKERFASEGSLLGPHPADLDESLKVEDDADDADLEEHIKYAAEVAGTDVLLQDPQFVELISRFISGYYDTRVPEYLREKSVEKKIELLQPLLAVWGLCRRIDEIPMLKPDQTVGEDGRIVSDEDVTVNLQDGLETEEPIDKDAWSRIMRLFEDDPELGEIVKLRTKLSPDLFDPDLEHERKGDFYFEDFTPENSTYMNAHEMGTVTKHFVDNDPFRSYFDNIPEGVKRIEYTVDVAASPREFMSGQEQSFKEVRRQLFKANNIHYNHIISKRKLKVLREGLSKYSGVPEHLLQFLDVFHNRVRGDLGPSNPDEVKFRENQLQLERLAQPSNPLANIDNRPDDSENEVPSISTPIVLTGPTHDKTVRRIQKSYQKHLENNPVQKRLDRYKVALITPSTASTSVADDSSSSEERFVVQDGMTELEEEFSIIKDAVIVEQARKLAAAKLRGGAESETEKTDQLYKDQVADVDTAFMEEVIRPELVNVYNRLATMPIEEISKFIMNGDLPDDFFDGLTKEAKEAAQSKLLGIPTPIDEPVPTMRDIELAGVADAGPVEGDSGSESLYEDPDVAEDYKDLLDEYQLDTVSDADMNLDPPLFARLDDYKVDHDTIDLDDRLMVGAILRREREMVRAMTAKLQIRSRSDRAALRRIFSLSPEYARDLVQRSILIADGNFDITDVVHPELSFQPIVTINWQKELADLEDRMIGYSNYMNAKTGGLYPGVPSVGRGDHGVFSPPDLLTGEFAPLFLDSNLQSSADELVHESLRLPGFANAIFPCVATTQFTDVKKESRIKDNLVNSVRKITDEEVAAVEAYEKLNLKSDDSSSTEAEVVESSDIVTFDELPADMKSWVTAFTEESANTVLNRWSASEYVNLLSKLTSIPTEKLQAVVNAHLGETSKDSFFNSDRLANNQAAMAIRDKLVSTIYHADDVDTSERASGIDFNGDVAAPEHYAATYFDETVARHALGEIDQQEGDSSYVPTVNGEDEVGIANVSENDKIVRGVVGDVHAVFNAISDNAEFAEQCKDLPRIALTLRNLFTTRSFISTFALKESKHGLVADKATLIGEVERAVDDDIFLLDSAGKLLLDSDGKAVRAQGITNPDAIAVREDGTLPNGVKLIEDLQAKGAEFESVISSTNDIIMTGFYNVEHGFIPTAYRLSMPNEYDSRTHIDRIKDRDVAHTNDYDPVVYGPSGYPVPPVKPRFVQLAEDIARRHGDDDPFLKYVRWSDDPEYNFTHLYSDVEGVAGNTPEIESEKELLTGMFPDEREKVGSEMSETREYQYVDPLDRPEEDDVVRRLTDPTITLTDMMTVRQYNTLQNIYDLRMAKNFFEGRLDPGEYAFVKNNYRLMDKAHDLDTFTDQENDLARIQKEMVVGVVKEWMDDHDIEDYRAEFDAHNVQPDYDPLHQHDDLLNAFAARRFSPYSSMPLSESNIPPLIGVELQKHVYNLHLLDPVTFHPRWIARRLNLTYPAAISMMKVQDMFHKAFMDQAGIEFHGEDEDNQEASEFDTAEIGPDANFDKQPGDASDLETTVVDGRQLAGEASPTNRDFNSDIPHSYPIEQTLDPNSPEHLFSRFAPTLIGRVSWTKNPEKFVGDLAWRHHQAPDIDMLGDEAMFDAYHYERQMNMRWASKEKLLDAMEKAAFSKWGPITWGNHKPGELHNPPKLPREIISTTLHPPSRHNWVLTQLDEAKENIYAICVRDKDGYLRHPTYREFRNVRLREKDRRIPFYWRRHHVLGKLPQISNLFVEQVHALKKQMADQYFPPGEHLRINETVAEGTIRSITTRKGPAEGSRVADVYMD